MLSQLGAREGTIIRSGEMGCCYLPQSEEVVRWVPPFYSATGDAGGSGASRVVDPTGAGNGFIGAVAAALDEGKDLREGT
jgi:sugar/nucleoside kinase (ribokinase family)